MFDSLVTILRNRVQCRNSEHPLPRTSAGIPFGLGLREDFEGTKCIRNQLKSNIDWIDYDRMVIDVGYEPIPSQADLEARFPGGVSMLWNAKKYELQSHESCLGVDEELRKREFRICPATREGRRDSMFEAAEKDGCRPATLKEALAFAQGYPHYVDRVSAFGSFVAYQGIRYSPTIVEVDGGLALESNSTDFVMGWNWADTLLFVCK